MAHSQPFIDRYRSMGDNLPPKEVLTETVRYAQLETSSSELPLSLVAAQSSIDLAMHAKNPGRATVLFREEHRFGPQVTPSFNPNWSVGLCLPGLAHTFRDPLRVRVNLEKRHNDDVYRAAGVVPIASRDCFFADPRRIVLSCMNEFEAPKVPDGMKLLGTDRLDAITAVTADRLQKGIEAVQEVATVTNTSS